MELIAEAGFNYDADKKKFGTNDRIVRLSCFTDDGQARIGFSFELGLKADDTMNLIFPLEELMAKLAKAIFGAD